MVEDSSGSAAAPRAVRVVVTGASGFIGSALCAAVRRAGHEAVGLDLRSGGFAAGDVVVHLAAIAHRRADAAELERVNVGLAKQVGQAAAAHGARLVFLSSVKVHGEVSAAPFTERSPIAPRDAYGESKAKAEEALRAIPGLRLAVLRPPLVYGPGRQGELPGPDSRHRARRAAAARLGEEPQEPRLPRQPGRRDPGLSRARGHLPRVGRLEPFDRAMVRSARAGVGQAGATVSVSSRACCRRSSPGRSRSTIRPSATDLGWRPPFTPEEGLRATARWYKGF